MELIIHVEIIDLCYLSTIMLAAQIHLLTKLSEHLTGPQRTNLIYAGRLRTFCKDEVHRPESYVSVNLVIIGSLDYESCLHKILQFSTYI